MLARSVRPAAALTCSLPSQVRASVESSTGQLRENASGNQGPEQASTEQTDSNLQRTGQQHGPAGSTPYSTPAGRRTPSTSYRVGG
jgi:hypothetical protein